MKVPAHLSGSVYSARLSSHRSKYNMYFELRDTAIRLQSASCWMVSAFGQNPEILNWLEPIVKDAMRLLLAC